MTNLHTAGQPGQSPMSKNTDSEDTKYIKRIDDLIEEAEIEAELEAEKRIRSKNTKLLSISIVSAALLLFLYVRMNGEEQIIAQAPEPELPVTEIKIPLAEDTAALDIPIEEKGVQATEQPEPAAEPAAPAEPAEPVAEVKPEPVKTSPAPVAEVKPEPVKEKTKPAPVPARRSEKLKIKTASTRGTEIPRPSRPTAPSRQYFVQTGVFSVEGNAKKLSNKLESAGFTPTITVKNRELKRHVVKVGQFANEAEGETLKKELTDRGFEAVLTRNPSGNFSFLTGSFKSASEAATFQDRLSLKGFLSTKEEKTVNLPLYAVELGGFASASQAKDIQAKLGQAGFDKHFVR